MSPAPGRKRIRATVRITKASSPKGRKAFLTVEFNAQQLERYGRF
jgi:hypothetical protein